MRELEKAHEIARARLYLKQGKHLKYYKEEFPDSVMAISSLYNYFADNPLAKPNENNSIPELQAEVDRLKRSILGLGSLTELETIKDCNYNTMKVMSALGITEDAAKDKIAICKQQATDEELALVEKVFDRLNEAITDEDLARYIDEYKELAREKLIILNYISEIIVGKCNSPKDFVALSKYEAKQFRLLRKKHSIASQSVTERTNKNKSDSAYEQFQKRMKS